MTTPRLLMLTAACALGASGCGQDSVALSVPQEVALDELPDRFRQAVCQLFARCGVDRDEASCVRNFAFADFGQLEASLQAGRQTYDGKRAAACLEVIQRWPCDKPGRAWYAEVCSFGAGTVGAGGVCFDSGDCVDRAPCDYNGCNRLASCCAGTCTRLPHAGSPCPERACIEGAYCEPGTDGQVGTCQARKDAGQPCRTDSPACAYPSVCIGTAGADGGTCVGPGADGEDCSRYSFCARAASTCDPVDKRCRPQRKVGEPCPPPYENSCVEWASCVAGVCTAKLDLGEACGASGPSCMSGNCVGAVCVARPPSNLPICK